MDPFETQSAISLLCQVMNYSHWYDRTKLQPRNLLGCQFVACMNPTAGSFFVNPRLQRHFFTLTVSFPGPTSLHTIFSTFLEGHLRQFSDDVLGLASMVIGAAMQLHTSVATAFRKSALNFHYGESSEVAWDSAADL